MSKKSTIYEYLQTQAISDILNRSDMNFFRKVCRWYSEKFHTPLHIVMEGNIIQWDEILLHYYESQMEELGYNDIYQMAIQEYIPELAEEFEEDNQKFAEALVAEQKATLKKKESAPSASDKKTEPVDTNENKDLAPPPPVKMNFEEG